MIYARLQIYIQLPATYKPTRYAILSATTIICSKCPPSAEMNSGWSHLIWHNFVTMDQKFPTVWEKCQKTSGGGRIVLTHGVHTLSSFGLAVLSPATLVTWSAVVVSNEERGRLTALSVAIIHVTPKTRRASSTTSQPRSYTNSACSQKQFQTVC